MGAKVSTRFQILVLPKGRGRHIFADHKKFTLYSKGVIH